MRRHISQREAHALKKRVAELEERNRINYNAWSSEFINGIRLGSIERDPDWLNGAIKTARRLRHAVVVKIEDDYKTIVFYACKP